jgi:hypothetical protein
VSAVGLAGYAAAPPRSPAIDDFDSLITAQIPKLRRYAFRLLGDRDRERLRQLLTCQGGAGLRRVK